MIYNYQSKGTADDWTTDSIEAKSKADAIKKLDAIYGIQRDEDGIQTNNDMIKVEIL